MDVFCGALPSSIRPHKEGETPPTFSVTSIESFRGGTLMAAELTIAAWACWIDVSTRTMASLGLVLLIWAVTGLFAAPVHQLLVEQKATRRHISQLLRAHHVRTGCWTLRCAIVVWGTLP